MRVGVLRASLRVPGARSLKEKRGPAKRLVAELRRTFGAAAAEVDAQDLHQRLVVGVAVVASDGERLSERLAAIEGFLGGLPDLPLLGVARESFPGP